MIRNIFFKKYSKQSNKSRPTWTKDTIHFIVSILMQPIKAEIMYSHLIENMKYKSFFKRRLFEVLLRQTERM